ncbi:zinc ribbon domain-containing protein [Marinicella rhabdoformis]|uniref:zinc ribbon domain-containing protein n=1 Tax=Marinicella rhabdoformis TaxID=2580566 RepID=UPI0012AEDD7A|nr:zinc ribbon domain-containing protein [Marinicella rhabdoformis]
MTKKTALDESQISQLTYVELLEHLRLSRVRSDEYLGLVKLLQKELALREPTVNYQCPHCGHDKYDERQMRSSGGRLSSIFEVQTNKYRVIVCQRCQFSQMFYGSVSNSQQVLDFLIGS